MRALSLFQPWASLVVAGVKRIDARCWRTGYRGPVAIYALDKFPEGAALKLCWYPTVRAALGGDVRRMPLGAILGTVELVECIRTEDLTPTLLTRREQLWGNYSPGKWAFVFRGAERFRTPVRAAGRTGLWLWREDHSLMAVPL
jgi:hypothetical protein